MPWMRLEIWEGWIMRHRSQRWKGADLTLNASSCDGSATVDSTVGECAWSGSALSAVVRSRVARSSASKSMSSGTVNAGSGSVEVLAR